MSRAVDGTRRRKRRQKILNTVKGAIGARGKLFRPASDQARRSLVFAYQSRRLKKRDFRTLWIARISAACRAGGLTYSQFMHGLQAASIQINRKALSNMAIEDPKSFEALIQRARTAAAAV